ncbi:MAG: alcohol dehydrogenase catalytic domain-containing protein [Gaiellaceae bacterium]
MKAARFHKYGDAKVIAYEDAPDPSPGPGEVLINVKACALNHVDIDIRNGSSRLAIELPHTLGFEFAGEIAALGEGVEGWAVGDRVAPLSQLHCDKCRWCARGQNQHCEELTMFGIQLPGGYAELSVAPAWALIPVPETVPFEHAASVQAVYGTGWHALTKRARIAEGDWVLVNAAASGVGTAAIQIARLLGGRVIASASSEEKLARARELGAEGTVNYASEDLTKKVRELTDGHGVAVVYESVGGELLEKSIAAMDTFGQLVLVGCHAGEVVPVDFIDLFRHEWTLLGAARATAAEFRHVMTLVADGRLTPIVGHTLPLAQAAEAHELMESRQHYGKIVLTA